MIPAPIMIAGVVVGATLCFSGNPLRKFWFPLRCFVMGALFMLCLMQLLLEPKLTEAFFAMKGSLRGFYTLLTGSRVWWHIVLKIVLALAGGTGFFLLGMAKKKGAVICTKLLTAFTTAFIATILIAVSEFAVVTLQMQGVITGVLTLILIPVCLQWFDYYYAAETGLFGALAIAYMFAQFYFLPLWVFWLIALVFAFCGIYSQEYMAVRSRQRLAAKKTVVQMMEEPPVPKHEKRKKRNKKQEEVDGQ